MKFITETKLIGECLGSIDWNYDFVSHFDGCSSKEYQEKCCQRFIEKLKQLTDGQKWMATTDGGWPRCGWGDIVEVGMYDGWPYWKPVPSVAILGSYGVEWHSFNMITDIKLKT